MISLNLSSNNARKELLKEVALNVLKDILSLVLAVILINTIFIFICRNILDKNFEEIKQQKQAVLLRNQPFNKEVTAFNQKLKAISQVQNDFVKWSEKISKISYLVPENIEVTNFNFDKKTNDFSMTGIALKRDDFLKLKNNLENSNFIFNINSPLSNLLKQENFEFTLTGKLTKY